MDEGFLKKHLPDVSFFSSSGLVAQKIGGQGMR